ncbi:MAG: FAD-dependent oxidoreductase [Desulfomonilia bacterium]|jgi:glycine/D-amino acid oxidase-like deaminating enzyme/nitrite reductase/ring-hydroxylating ferredoxin subunit
MSEENPMVTDPVGDLPGRPTTLWLDTAPQTDYLALDGELKVDALVVGGGIAGLTTGVLLQEAGVKTAVIDSRRIAAGVSGHTTAKVTSLHGAIYHKLIKLFGTERAGMYAAANQAGLDGIADLVAKKNIDCDFSRVSAYTYGVSDRDTGRIEEEVKASQSVGLPTFYVDDTPLPFPTKGAVCLREQARFHPRKYLLALAASFTGAGGQIFENTRAVGIRKEGTGYRVTAGQSEIRAGHVIAATNFPFYDPAFAFARMYQKRSYVLGIRITHPAPQGMFISIEEPFHSIRRHPIENGEIILVGGQVHRTGHVCNTAGLYKRLERFARDHFDVSSIEYRWSTQDNVTVDMVPFIGNPSPMHGNFYIITGFAGWGMAHSMVAAMIVSDGILGRANQWRDLYSPFRFRPGSTLNLMEQNLYVAGAFLKDRLATTPQAIDAEALAPGQGGIFASDHGRTGIARDHAGNLHTVSPVCTHMGCLVRWNNAEESWDCPCHGSRFDSDGGAIHAPAKKDLVKKPVP